MTKRITPAEFVAKLTARGWRLATIVEDGEPTCVLAFPADHGNTMTMADRRFFDDIYERGRAAAVGRRGRVARYLHKKSLFFTELPERSRFGVPYLLHGL